MPSMPPRGSNSLSSLVPSHAPLVGRTLGEDFRVAFRIEDNSRYIVRVDVPGFEPDKEIEVTVGGGTLTIQAERRHKHNERALNFRRGRFIRRIAVPNGADKQSARATYHDGIVEITFTISRRTVRRPTGHRRVPHVSSRSLGHRSPA